MRVCFVNEKMSNGGISIVSKRLGECLKNDGVDVSFYAFMEFEHKPNIFFNKHFLKNIFFRIYKLNFKIYRRVLLYWSFFFLNQSIDTRLLYPEEYHSFKVFLEKNNFDAVILSGGMLSAYSKQLKKEFPNLKVIVWQHNEASVYVNKYYKYYKQSYLNGIKSADRVVCLTKTDLAFFSKYNSNVYFVPNFLDDTLFDDLSIEGNYKNKEKIINFTGRLVFRQKGIDLLAKIAKNIPDDWNVNIIGSGNFFVTLYLKTYIKIFRLQSKVSLGGRLESKDLTEMYKKSSVFISTSRWEGFGLVLVEAMAAGNAVISFNTSGPREILKGGKYGILVENFDVTSFSDQLNKLCNNDKELNKFQKVCYERSTHYKYENVRGIWLEIIFK